MGIFDDLIKRGEDEPEVDLGSGFTQLPVGKWFLLRPLSGEQKGKCALEDPTEFRAWPTLRLGLEILGAEEGVEKKNYGTVFARMALDTKNAPGEPSGRLQALANTFLASGLEHDSPERKRKTIDVLAAFAVKLEMKEEDYESPAEFYAAVLAEALTSDRLVVLGKTYLRKGRAYTDKQTGKPAVSQDRVEMGDWTDATDENLEKFGIVMWEVTI